MGDTHLQNVGEEFSRRYRREKVSRSLRLTWSECPPPPVPISSLGLFLFPKMAVMTTNVQKETKERRAQDQPCE